MKQESNMKLEDRRAIGETKELILVIQYSFKRKSTAGAGPVPALCFRVPRGELVAKAL
jgi:hypothetical protein